LFKEGITIALTDWVPKYTKKTEKIPEQIWILRCKTKDISNFDIIPKITFKTNCKHFSHLVPGVFCGQSHGRVEELGEGLAEVVQHELDLLPVRKTTNLFKRCNHLFRFHDFLTPI
jgi:hypothetical protein